MHTWQNRLTLNNSGQLRANPIFLNPLNRGLTTLRCQKTHEVEKNMSQDSQFTEPIGLVSIQEFLQATVQLPVLTEMRLRGDDLEK
jgi:hypothetical protein